MLFSSSFYLRILYSKWTVCLVTNVTIPCQPSLWEIMNEIVLDLLHGLTAAIRGGIGDEITLAMQSMSNIYQ